MRSVGRIILFMGILATFGGPPPPSVAQTELIDSDPVAAAAEELRDLRQEVLELRRAREPIPPELRDRERELRDIISGRGDRTAAVDPDLRAEYEDVRDRIRELRDARMEVPRDLLDRERELRDAVFGRRRGSDRSRRSSRNVDPELRKEYNDVHRQVKALRASGMAVPPDLAEYEQQLRDEIYGRRGRGNPGVDPDLTAERDELKRQMADLRRARAPVPPDLQQRYAEVQRLISDQQKGGRQADRPRARDPRARELEGLLRHIEALESQGKPVPESLVQRAEDLDRDLAEAGPDRRPPKRRASRADLQRNLDLAARQIDRLESQGREVPEALLRKAEALDDQLARGDFAEDQPDQPPDPLAQAGVQLKGRDRGVPDRTEKELDRVDRLIERIESAGRPVPERLLTQREDLLRRLEPGSEATGLPGEREPSDSAGAVGPPDPVAEKAALREARDRAAAVDAQGATAGKKVDAQSAEMQRRLAEATGLQFSASGTPSTPRAGVADEAHRRDAAKLEKIRSVISKLGDLGEPVPDRLRRSAKLLEQRLAGGAKGDGPGRKRASDRNNRARELVVKLEAKLQRIEKSIAQLRDAGKEVPAKLTTTAASYRRQLAQARRRAGRKRYSDTDVVPFEEWGAYVEDLSARYGFDGTQRSAAMQIVRECQGRITPRVEARRPSGASVQPGSKLNAEERRIAEAVFAELKRRVDYLVTPAQRAAAQAAPVASGPQPSRSPKRMSSSKRRGQGVDGK